MTRLSKQDWLEQSLLILAEVGASELTIDKLTQKLGVTKGSFYHHFKGYQDFKIALLEMFEEKGTLNVIRITEEASTPENKLQRLLETTTGYPENLELQIRAWALQDNDVRKYQERIDRQRMEYLKDLYLAITGDEHKSMTAAKILYTVYIGSQQMIPPIREQELADLYSMIQVVITGQN
jgi:AcrR family transcriptional regulator